MTAAKIYTFNDYSFDAEKLELHHGDARVPLKVQPARLLRVLLENAPDTVSRQTIQDRIWDNGTTVEFEHGLNACVNQLRTALGDTARHPTYIKTLPKRGYQFVAAFETSDVFKASVRARRNDFRLAYAVASVFAIIIAAWFVFGGASVADKPTRVYVAPVTMSAPDQLALDGVVQYALRLGTVERLSDKNLEIIQTLSGDSLWKNLDPGLEKLGIDYSLFIDLARRNADEFAVKAQVVNARTEKVFDHQVFAVETLDVKSLSNLSERIAAWSAGLFGSSAITEPPIYAEHQPAYYDAMVRAQRAFQVADPQSLRESLKWFEEALRRSPASYEAKGGRAMALTLLAGQQSDYPAATTYRQALDIADDIRQTAGPTVHSELVRGYIFLYYDWDVERSKRAFGVAAELAPGNPIVHSWRAAVLAVDDQPVKAALAADMAVKLDPLSMSITSDRCWYLSAAERYDEAIEACNWVLELSPDDEWAQVGLVTAFMKQARYDDAIEVLRPIADNMRASLPQSSNIPIAVSGAVSGRKGYIAAVCAIKDMLEPRVMAGEFSAAQAAAFSAECGTQELTARLLKLAKDAGDPSMLFYATNPRFDTFRQSPAADTVDLTIQKRDVLQHS